CRVCFFSICFFFSSRRRHTRFSRDWSSDVCSSDLGVSFLPVGNILSAHLTDQASIPQRPNILMRQIQRLRVTVIVRFPNNARVRSEERRVGKECRSRWSQCQ